MRSFFALFALAFIFSTPLTAQNLAGLRGQVIDAATKEGLPFSTIALPGTGKGFVTDINGFFEIKEAVRSPQLQVSCIGYRQKTVDAPKQFVDIFRIELEADVAVTSEVVVRPKKYRNKNNPAVELIENVIKNRNVNRTEGFESYQEEQYEKIFVGLSNLSEKFKNRKMMKSWKVLTDNTDTTLLAGQGITPVYFQESLQDFYSQRSPKRSKIWVSGQKKVKFPLIDEDGLEKYLRYLYQEANIYDDYVILLTDHFISPISDRAPIFYRYYPADTAIVEGSKVVRLEFFPRNKTDMLLQGELFIALDSTYPVTKITYTVNPNVNLNWARKVETEQTFKKLPSGKWALDEEDYLLDFGATANGTGIFARRTITHRDQKMGVKLPDSLFQKNYEYRSLRAGAEAQDTGFWAGSRHVALTATEARTYAAMDSVLRTPLFQRVSKTLKILIGGYWKPGGGIEIGRLNTFFAFNPVEGNRFRFGGRTSPQFSKRFNFEGFVAYGMRDERWKYGIGTNICLTRGRAYNRFPYHLFRANYQQDLLTPGVLVIGTFTPTSLASSVVRGTNDRFLFQKKLVLQYEREFYNRFSFILGYEHRDLSPLGSLQFKPTDDSVIDANNVVAAAPFLQIRYAPGEEFYQIESGWRQRIRFKTITTLRYSRGIEGFMGGQYKYDNLTASIYRFSNLPPIGYNYFYIEAGGIFGKVPYPLLTVHRANQTFGYRFMAFNLMNFMEFVSDRYVWVNMEHNFYGFFLNKIPLIKKLKFREYATCKVLYGQISSKNKPTAGSGLFELPTYSDGTPLTYSLEKKPYIEASVGLGNIFKVLRVDLVRRFSYLDHPETSKFGVRVAAAVQF